MQRFVNFIALTSAVAVLTATYRITSVGKEGVRTLRIGSSRRLNTHGGLTIGEDCNSDGSICKYLRPVLFVRETLKSKIDKIPQSPQDQNLQFGFNYSFEQVCERYGNSLPSLFFMECDSENDGAQFCIEEEADSSFSIGLKNLPKHFTYKHIRKAGGHSVDFALQRLNLYRMTHIQDGRGPQNATIRAEDLMSKIETHQKGGNAQSHPLIAIVRDPIQRFVNAAAQAIKDDRHLAQRCLAGSGSMAPTLRCILTEVEQGYAFPTFVPMIADMYCNARGHNVIYSVYNFDELPAVIKALGESDENAVKQWEGSDIPISCMDDLMRFRLCRLYWSDVLMMRTLGYPVSTCPDSMPA